jgi:IPT/TIG domain-containing protein
MTMRHLLLVLLTPLAFSVSGFGQTLPTRWSVSVGGTTALVAVSDLAVLDDLDGDGVADLAVGIKLSTHDFFPFPDGFAEVRSGADGSLLHTIAPPAAASSFGLALVVTDDLDGDGLRDLGVLQHVDDPATGTVDFSAHVHLYSSGNAALLGTAVGPLTQPPFAPTLDCVTDLNGDGVREIAICSTDGSLFMSVEARFVDPLGLAAFQSLIPAFGTNGQCSLFGVDDRDGDGQEDFLFSYGSAAGEQPVEVRSGADLSLLASFASSMGFSNQAGQHLRPAGDIDADGTLEFMYADNLANWTRIRDGLTGANKAVIQPIGVQYFYPQAMGPLGDADGDGFDDFYAIDNSSFLRVFSGRFQREQSSWATRANLGPFVRALRAFGDINGDGLDEFVVGVGSEVRMMSLGGARRFGLGLPLDLAYRRYPVAGGTVGALDFSGAAPFAPGVIAVSMATDPTGVDILLDATPEQLVVVETFNADFWGEASFGVNLAQPLLAGQSVFVQAASLQGGMVTTSKAVELQFVASRMEINGVAPVAAQGGETITVSGEGFDPNVQVILDGQTLPTIAVSGTSIQFIAPAPMSYDLELLIRNPQGESAARTFHPTPQFNNVVPSSGPAAGGNNLLIFGGPFPPAATVTVGGVPLTITTLATSVIVGQAPPAAPGTVPLVVTFPAPGGGVFTLTGTYTYF